jgi:hypothetical protein
MQYCLTNLNWPSTNKALCTALICIALSTHEETNITIYTDKKQFIQNAQNSINTPPWQKAQLHKTFLWPSWLTLNAITTQRSLNISFQYTDSLDLTIQPNPTIHCLDITHTAIRHDTFTIHWLNACVEHIPRRFIRHLNNAEHIAIWHSQNRMSKWDQLRKEIDWEAFHNFLNYKNKPTTRYTHPSDSKLKAFKLKFLLEELPVRLVLNTRNPKKYPDPTCQRCKAVPETNAHWIQCQTNTISLDQIILDSITNLLTKH